MPEVVVLRVYGDNLFAIPFDRSTRVFERQLFILKVSEMGKTPFTMEKVGPLVPPHLPLQPMIVVPPDPR
jgi:hypothetical protein